MKTLALSMIVRNAAAELRECLESARGVVEEMVLADTGSADQTIEVAEQCGARVVSIPWTNDFAEARNRALAEVKSDWVLVLDADERLDAGAAPQIRRLIESSDIAGYLVTIRNYVRSLDERVWDTGAKPNDSLLPSSAAYPGFIEHENVRLFRRAKEIYFVGRVHESVGPRIQELGRKLAKATFRIHHFGLAADEDTRARKNQFYRELGRQKVLEMPGNAQAHFELGLVELDNFRNYPEALARFERACELDPKLGVAWFFRGLTLLKLERLGDSAECLAEAEKRGHRTALVAETWGDALYTLKDFSRASEKYLLALRRDPGNPNLESKLGLALVRAGKAARGLATIEHAIARRPKAGELRDRLVLALVSLSRLAEAAEAAEQKLEFSENLQPGDFVRAASLWAKVSKWNSALAAVRRGLQRYPEHQVLGQALQEILQMTRENLQTV